MCSKDNGKSVTAILSAVYDAGAGTQNIALSDVAFAQIQDTAGQTTLSPVTWAFD
jgi:ribosomal protein L25 (general stress protein Ctc)